MSYTYAGNPAASAVALVHYRLGDVDPANPLSSDEECAQALIDAGGNSYLAAAILAETRVTMLLMRPSMEKRDNYTVQYGQQAETLLKLAQTLRLQANMRGGMPYAGGISRAEKEAARHPSDDVRPFATKELHTHPSPYDPARDDL